MKADLVSLDAARTARARHDESWRNAARLPGKARAVLVATALAMIAFGIVCAALWLAWMLADAIP
jgi:hypothetical protein